MKRKSISKSLRFEIFKRDGFQCQYCGKKTPYCTLHIDHIHPVSKGGDNDADNLITSCDSCNLGKSNNLLSESKIGQKPRLDAIKEKELQICAYNDFMREVDERMQFDCWEIVEILEGRDGVEEYNRKRLISIKGFIKKLPFHEVKDAAEIAYHKKRLSTVGTFKYFCGICWNKVKEAQDG